MTQSYRVIQWMTGNVGKPALAHFAENPIFDLVGVLVSNPDKVGKDAGDIAGVAPTGVIATDDVDVILGLDADVVFYTPIIGDVDTVCRILRTGKNIVTTSGPFHPTPDTHADGERIRQACRDGGTSFYGGGIHPGFAGDLLPLTLARIMSRVDKVEVYEVVNALEDIPHEQMSWFGFGVGKDEFLANPGLLGFALPFFGQAMAIVAEGLGEKIDRLTSDVSASVATADIAYDGGVVTAGTVAAQHHEWTGWVGERPFVVFHALYTMGGESAPTEPASDYGKTRYRIVLHGDPGTEVTLEGLDSPDGSFRHPGFVWTTMAAVNAIPHVCDAAPGWVTQLDVGFVEPRGLVR